MELVFAGFFQVAYYHHANVSSTLQIHTVTLVIFIWIRPKQLMLNTIFLDFFNLSNLNQTMPRKQVSLVQAKYREYCPLVNYLNFIN